MSLTFGEPVTIPCMRCQRPTDPYSPSTLHETVGLARRRKGEGGGLNALSFPRETGRVMCEDCVIKCKRLGLDMALQGSLL